MPERKCLICGEIHGKEMCPELMKKIQKFEFADEEVSVWAQIFFTCIQKKINFYDFLLYIAEYQFRLIEIMNKPRREAVPLGDMRRTSEIILGGSLKKVTCKEVCDYIENNYGHDAAAHISGKNVIRIDFKLDENVEPKYSRQKLFGLSEYEFSAEREYCDDGEYKYELDIEIPCEDIFYNTYEMLLDKKPHFIVWESEMGTSQNSICLMSDKHGELKKFFEEEFIDNDLWEDEELAIEHSYNDPLMKQWIKKLTDATEDSLIRWTKCGKTSYSSIYDEMQVRLYTRLPRKIMERQPGLEYFERISSEILKIQNPNGTANWFGYGEHYESEFENYNEEDCHSKELLDFANYIDNTIKNRNDSFINHKRVKIECYDIIVKAGSLMCRMKEHRIIPMIGVVALLTSNNERIDYEIYVGYCRNCNTYIVFREDYSKMCSYGKPLCIIRDILDGSSTNNPNSVTIKNSRSVLNKMGYNVNAKENVPTEERHRILISAIESEVLSIHEIIDFLRWLVASRRHDPKYVIAASKWEDDIEYIKSYSKEKREKVVIKSITIR